MLSGAAVPGPQCESGGRGVVRCRARPMRPLANPWTVLHDPWRFGYVLGEMRAMMCGMMCGSVAVRSEIVARVILIILVCARLSGSRTGRTRVYIGLRR